MKVSAWLLCIQLIYPEIGLYYKKITTSMLCLAKCRRCWWHSIRPVLALWINFIISDLLHAAILRSHVQCECPGPISMKLFYLVPHPPDQSFFNFNVSLDAHLHIDTQCMPVATAQFPCGKITWNLLSSCTSISVQEVISTSRHVIHPIFNWLSYGCWQQVYLHWIPMGKACPDSVQSLALFC